VSEYHKIQSVFLRDRDTNRLIDGAWTMPEFDYGGDSGGGGDCEGGD
jgi:hypothetical protein